MRFRLPAFVLLALLTASHAQAQECVTCWTDACPELGSYTKPCEGAAKKPKKTHKPKDTPATDSTPSPAPSTAPAPSSCVEGQAITDDTDGHCCWPGQTWGKGLGCVGIPDRCPSGFQIAGQTCSPPACEGARVRMGDAVHCCWKGQAWSKTKARCVGIPAQCPAGTLSTAEDCLTDSDGDGIADAVDKCPTVAGVKELGGCPAAAAPPVECHGGLVSTQNHCCWPGQSWVNDDGGKCGGVPTQCPSGQAADDKKETCLTLDRLGLATEPLHLAPAQAKRLGVESAVLVAHVEPHSPAAAAELARYDVILEVNSIPTPQPEVYQALLAKLPAGQLMMIKISRGKKQLQAAVKVGP